MVTNFLSHKLRLRVFSLIQTHHSLGKATRRSKRSSQRNHRWCWNRQTVGRNHQVFWVIPLTHVETQGWTPMVSFHHIQTFHRFKFDVCYPNIPKPHSFSEIVLRVNDCTFYCASIDAFDVTDCGFSKVSGQEASQGPKFSNQTWRYFLAMFMGSTLLEYHNVVNLMNILITSQHRIPLYKLSIKSSESSNKGG